MPCPANSMSTSVGSNGCGCLRENYRNHLEDNHFPCTSKKSDLPSVPDFLLWKYFSISYCLMTTLERSLNFNCLI